MLLSEIRRKHVSIRFKIKIKKLGLNSVGLVFVAEAHRNSRARLVELSSGPRPNVIKL